MPEILNLQVGQCGNQIGSAFWNVIGEEHGIRPDGVCEGTSNCQLDKLNVYFNESTRKRYTPRSVIVDLDSSTIDSIRSSTFGDVYPSENFIWGNNSAGHIWARGYYTEGAEISGHVQEALRREAENCDCLQGFQLIHSLGGGTGSGLGTLLLSKIRDEYPDRMVNTYSVIPSCKVQDTIVSPYNVLFSFQQLLHYSDLTFCIDNQALYTICRKILKLPRIRFSDLNHLVSLAMSGVTTCLRYPGQMNSDLRKLAVNMIPYPRLHFMMTSLAPLIPKSRSHKLAKVTEVVQQMFHSRNVLAACDPRQGRYLTASATFRGLTSSQEIESEMLNIQTNDFSNFIQWIPNNVKTVECEIPLKYVQLSGIFLGNNTVIHEVLKRVSLQFALMFKRKAFLQWFTSEGIEENEFTDAYGEVLDLVSEYQQHETLSSQKENPDDAYTDNY